MLWSNKRLGLAMIVAAGCREAPVEPPASSLSQPIETLARNYSAVMLPPGLIPAAINSSLMVIGSAPCSGCPFPYRQPVRWTPAGGIAALPRPADWAGDFAVRDLNNLGEVAGIATVGGTVHAVRWAVDDTPQALGHAYYIPGSTINDAGVQAWVQIVGPHSNPSGFDVRLWSPGGETSLGVLPYDPTESAYWAPFRLKVSGTLVWGYGRWLYTAEGGWKQYNFPVDVISSAQLRDASPQGTVVGTGYRATSEWQGYQGYLWEWRKRFTTTSDDPVELGQNFLPELVAPTDLMAGHLIHPTASAPPYQEPAIFRKTAMRLPVPPAPPNYAFAWGWVFDLTDDGQAAVGSVVYYDTTTTQTPGPPVGGGILWTRGLLLAPVPALQTTVAMGGLTDDLVSTICAVPTAAASGFCSHVSAPFAASR